jgi:hypothetical protein
MSGLYNVLFGENSSQKDFLFELLGCTPADFGRYRDIYVTEEYIVVHTRCGGGNREDYEDVFWFAESLPDYAYNEDCDYDYTYADIFFHHPKGYEDLLKEMAKGTIIPSEKWKMILEAMGK